MSDNMLAELQRRMLLAEGVAIDKLPELTLEELVIFYQEVNEDILDNSKHIEQIIRKDKFAQEAIFSTFRVLKAILAEIEYRIKENKI